VSTPSSRRAIPNLRPKKHRQAFAGIDRLFGDARDIGYDKIVVGSDIISSPEAITTLNQELIARTKWFRPIEILRQATSKAGELLALSGPMNPYPGKLGVIEEGAYADLLVVNGNPLEDMEVLLDHAGRFDLIIKDGVVCRNALAGSA
jgi:imidazolonepropionase-like amidohydrolase